MTDLVLNVKTRWFDLIVSGKKDREYRMIKPYWTKRLVGKQFDRVVIVNRYPPKPYNDTNSISFPYRGFEIAKIHLDDVSEELGIPKYESVYAIILEK